MTNALGEREVYNLTKSELDRLAVMIDEIIVDTINAGKTVTSIGGQIGINPSYLSMARKSETISKTGMPKLSMICMHFGIKIGKEFPWTKETMITAREQAETIGKRRKQAQLAAALKSKEKKPNNPGSNVEQSPKDKAISDGHLKEDVKKDRSDPIDRKRQKALQDIIDSFVRICKFKNLCIVDHEGLLTFISDLDLTKNIEMEPILNKLITKGIIEYGKMKSVPVNDEEKSEKMSTEEFEELRKKAQEVIDKGLDPGDLSEELLEKLNKAKKSDSDFPNFADMLVKKLAAKGVTVLEDDARDPNKEPFKGLSVTSKGYMQVPADKKQPTFRSVEHVSSETFSTYKMYLNEDLTLKYVICVGSDKYEILEMGLPHGCTHRLIHSRDHLKLFIQFLQNELNDMSHE